MNKFLKAAGFGALCAETDVYDFLKNEVIKESNAVTVLYNGDGSIETEYVLFCAEHVGLAAVTVTYPDGTEQIKYSYPFFDARDYTSEEPCALERHTVNDSYAGLIDEYKIGVSLIFFVQFSLAYKSYLRLAPETDFRGTALTAFANDGVVLLPVIRTKAADATFMMGRNEKERLYEAAMHGDTEAMETLTASDMDIYNEAAGRIQTEDLYSVVEQSFIPSGIECDQYSVIGEIMSVEETKNRYTGEDLWLLSLESNEVMLKLCIRKQDLLGEPLCGRRVKARIWLLGNVDLRRPV